MQPIFYGCFLLQFSCYLFSVMFQTSKHVFLLFQIPFALIQYPLWELFKVRDCKKPQTKRLGNQQACSTISHDSNQAHNVQTISGLQPPVEISQYKLPPFLSSEMNYLVKKNVNKKYLTENIVLFCMYSIFRKKLFSSTKLLTSSKIGQSSTQVQ